jgi:hypothetical protein
VYLPDECFIIIKLNPRRIRLLQLEITVGSVAQSITKAKLPVPVKDHQVPISLGLHVYALILGSSC